MAPVLLQKSFAVDRRFRAINLLKSAAVKQLIAAHGQKLVRDNGLKTECQIAGYRMRSLADFRSGKPGFYPDQSVYAEYACAAFGLSVQDIDGGTGPVFQGR